MQEEPILRSEWSGYHWMEMWSDMYFEAKENKKMNKPKKANQETLLVTFFSKIFSNLTIYIQYRAMIQGWWL